MGKSSSIPRISRSGPKYNNLMDRFLYFSSFPSRPFIFLVKFYLHFWHRSIWIVFKIGLLDLDPELKLRCPPLLTVRKSHISCYSISAPRHSCGVVSLQSQSTLLLPEHTINIHTTYTQLLHSLHSLIHGAECSDHRQGCGKLQAAAAVWIET